MPEQRPHWTRYFDPEAVARIAAVGLQPLERMAGNLVGNHPSPYQGFAIEFAGHRPYTPGDDIRHLDWKVYFKSDRFMIKQYEQDTNLIAHLVIDVSETMNFTFDGRRKADVAGFIAVALASAILSQHDNVSTTFFADEILETVPPTGSEDIISKIAGYLAQDLTRDDTAVGRALMELAERIGQRKIVFVVSDFFNDRDELFDGVKRLLFGRNEVILLHLLDPIEMDFSHGGPVELVELEGHDRMNIRGASIRDSYNQLFGEYLDEMRERTRKLGVDYLICDTSRNFGFTLAEYLNTRVTRTGG
mgnify:CR=1 FL=1